MQSVNVQIKHLKAALICAANKDIRYYLNGVLIDVRRRDVLVVSTDGHRLACIRTSVVPEGEPDQAPAQIIIPRDMLKGLKGATAKQETVTLQYDAAQPLAPCTLSPLNGGNRIFKPEDARYPDYSRVIPNVTPTAAETAKPAHFNPHYVADFARIAEILIGTDNKAFADIYPRGDSSAAVRISGAPEFIGAIMPMRWDTPDFEPVDWLQEPAPGLRKAQLKAA